MQIIAFLLISCTAVTSLIFVVGNRFDHLTSLAEQLNLAGRLRMLSQRISLEAEAVELKSPGANDALRRTLAEFEQSLIQQTALEPESSTAAAPIEVLRLQSAWKNLHDVSDALIQAQLSGAPSNYSRQNMLLLSNLALEAAEANVQRLLPRFNQARLSLRWLLPITLMGGVVLTLLMYYYLHRRLLQPIAQLRRFLDKLADGALRSRLQVRGDDEMADLFVHANRAATMLESASVQQAKDLVLLRDSELRNRTLWEISTDAIVMLDIDSIIRYANPSSLDVFGYSPEEIIGQNIAVLQPPELRAQHIEGMQRYLQSGHRKLNWSSIETKALHRQGHTIHVDLSFSHMRLSDTQWFVGTFRDVSQRKSEQERLRLNERAMASTSEGILITDANAPDHPITFANHAVSVISGIPHADIMGRSGRIFFNGDDLQSAEVAALRRMLQSGSAGTVTVRSRRIDGSAFWNELSIAPVLDSNDRVTHFVSVLKDVSERKRHEEALIRSANFDALTGLPNRVLLNDRIDQELISARRYQRAFGLLAIDLDNFKIVNDNLGHDAGDVLLCEARDRLLACIRENDSVSRVGGDEFVILLSELIEQEDIDILARRVLSTMERPFNISGSEVFVGASIGAAIFPRDGASRSELLQHADIAMYRAKDQGRNNYQHYADHMQSRFKLRMSMETQLRRALENEEFELFYQPQIAVATGRVTGAEALIRWRSPSLGMVSPAQFIPLAEETGLILPIGSWVIDRAMRDLATWLQLPGGSDCQVAINLSARQFSQPNLLEIVADGLQKNLLQGDKVELEITESLVMTNPQRAKELLASWRALGCHIAIDDFGTGYSSLAYLRHFPLDRLKIDKTLVNDHAIVKAVIELAHSFGMQTVAEGVEDMATLDMLHLLGCDLIQGYYYSKPLPIDTFIAYLAQPSCAATNKPLSAYQEESL